MRLLKRRVLTVWGVVTGIHPIGRDSFAGVSGRHAQERDIRNGRIRCTIGHSVRIIPLLECTNKIVGLLSTCPMQRFCCLGIENELLGSVQDLLFFIVFQN